MVALPLKRDARGDAPSAGYRFHSAGAERTPDRTPERTPAGAERTPERKPARCCAAPRGPLASQPPTWGQMDLTPERINSGTFWLFLPSHEDGWSLISLSLLFFSVMTTVPMDIYSSTLSQAVDIGAGCYLLLVGEFKAARKARGNSIFCWIGCLAQLCVSEKM